MMNYRWRVLIYVVCLDCMGAPFSLPALLYVAGGGDNNGVLVAVFLTLGSLFVLCVLVLFYLLLPRGSVL